MKTFTSIKSYLGLKKPIPQCAKPIVQEVVNRVEPLKTEFKSTKDLFSYVRTRCTDALKIDKPYEHAVLGDIKKNKVIAEYAGTHNQCQLNDLGNLSLDKDNTIIFHGHPGNYPISPNDIDVLLHSNIAQVVAFDTNGDFSLVAKTAQTPLIPNKKAFQDFKLANSEETADVVNTDIPFRSLTIDDVLKRHIPLMGLRYISNYAYLRH